MTLIDLLKKVGLEHVFVQPLLECLTNISTDKKGVSKITFKTTQCSTTEIVAGSPRMIALIVWMPADKIKKAQE